MLQMCCATCPSNQPRCMCRQHHERRTNRCNGRRTHLLVLATPITSVFLNYSIHNSTLHLCGNCQPSIFFVNFFGKSSMGQCVVPRRFGDGISTITNQRIACIGGFNAALAAGDCDGFRSRTALRNSRSNVAYATASSDAASCCVNAVGIGITNLFQCVRIFVRITFNVPLFVSLPIVVRKPTLLMPAVVLQLATL